MVGRCAERGYDNALRVVLDLEVSGKKKARSTEEDQEEASGGGDREDWFKKRSMP